MIHSDLASNVLHKPALHSFLISTFFCAFVLAIASCWSLWQSVFAYRTSVVSNKALVNMTRRLESLIYRSIVVPSYSKPDSAIFINAIHNAIKGIFLRLLWGSSRHMTSPPLLSPSLRPLPRLFLMLNRRCKFRSFTVSSVLSHTVTIL